ncbi:MAG: WYL domain-containing protein [Anaerolineae bacterium]
MRADRLITILLLLQYRREMTAGEFAEELGVSERTIYRDIEALCEIGIPIYADRGAAGGYRLVEDYRSDLDGLTRDERSALNLLDLPEPLTDLAIGRQLRNALLKLYSAGASGPQRVLLDWTSSTRTESTPVLQHLYDAIEGECRVRLRYRLWGFLDVETEAAPYGLVLSGGAWHLVCETNGRLRAIAVGELTDMEVRSESCSRPPDIDLKATWAKLSEAAAPRPSYVVTLRVAPRLGRASLEKIGLACTELESEAEGWRRVQLTFDHEQSALRAILGLGSAVEVVAPEALRLTVQDYAVQILRRYGQSVPDVTRP